MTEVTVMANDRNYDDSEYSQYYDDFPFKSYDEILEARRRAGTRRKGCLAAFLLIFLLLGLTIAFTFFSGSFIARRLLASLSDKQSNQADSQTAVESNGDAVIQLQPHDDNASALIMTYDVSSVVEKAAGCVVGIVTESYANFSSVDTGSGIIMSGDGYIITNNHVIEGGDSITVVLQDGSNYPAYLIGADSQTDIAVLKIQPESSLDAAEFGDSDTLRVGEPAIAIGNPGGLDLQGTVTAGIISAVNREITIDNNIMHLLQTDASINPGNSGGPLLNQYGQVVGVTSSKISATGYEGLGFAIPTSTVKPIVEELIRNGYVSGRPLIGVSVRTISQMAAAFYNPPRGLLVDAVAADSAAAAAGLQANDIITHLCGEPVRSVSDACQIRNRYKAGDTVTLSFYRSGSVYDIEFSLDEQQSSNPGWDF